MTFNSASISMELQTLLAIAGVVALITGGTNLLKIKTRDKGYQLNMNIILIITGIANLALGFYVLANLHIFAEALPLAENILAFLAVLGIIGTFVEILMTFSKNMKLYGFLEEKRNYKRNNQCIQRK